MEGKSCKIKEYSSYTYSSLSMRVVPSFLRLPLCRAYGSLLRDIFHDDEAAEVLFQRADLLEEDASGTGSGVGGAGAGMVGASSEDGHSQVSGSQIMTMTLTTAHGGGLKKKKRKQRMEELQSVQRT